MHRNRGCLIKYSSIIDHDGGIIDRMRQGEGVGSDITPGDTTPSPCHV
ncbi:MAG: hypothetical protein GX754_12285 [Clostridiaceae bacterium]|nr:hypothetical protein [Clostridiaceae bacterium]